MRQGKAPTISTKRRRQNGMRHSLHLPRWIRLGIRQKIALVLASVLVVTLTLSTVVTLRSQKAQILEETHRRGVEVSQLIAQNLGYSVVGYNYHAIEMVVRELLKNEDIDYVRVESAKGNTMTELGARQDVGPHRVTFSQDIRINDAIVGKLYLGLSTQRIVAQLEAQQQASFLRQFLVIVTIMAVEFIALSYIIVRPIGIIARTLSAGADTNSAPRTIPITSKDEFGELATQFNALHGELDDAHRAMKSRVDWANEELKTANEQLKAQAAALTRANADLQQLSVTDPLTGLYNRRHFEKLMENEVALSIRNDETNSIILIDIDHFKQVNTEYGHTVGDDLLRTVAGIIAARLRKTDVACRYGGDEFFVLCRRATISNAVSIADELQHAVTDLPLQVDGVEISISLSMGVATIPGVKPVSSAEDFFRCADLALSECKRRGRNQVIHFCMLNKDRQAAFHA